MFRTRRTAVSAQIVAVVVVVVVLVAALAGYFLLASPSAGSSSTPASPTPPSSTSTSSALVSSIAPVSTSTAGNSPIPIGVLTEITGPTYAYLGNEEWLLSNLAAKEINSSGGVMGHPLQLIKYDDQASTTTALTGVRVLDQTDNVLAVTGPTDTDVALAVKGYVEANGVPFIVPVAASPDLTAPGSQWTFRIELNAVGVGAAVGKYASNANQGAKAAILAVNAGFQRQEAAGARYVFNTYKNDSISIVYDQIFPSTQSDFTAIVAAVKLAGASIIVTAPTAAENANLNQALLNAGYTTAQIFSTSDASTLASTGANMLGISGDTFGDAATMESTPNGTAFLNKVLPILNACTICLNGAKVISPTETFWYDYYSVYFIAQAIKIVLSSGQPLTRANFASAMHSVKGTDPNGYPVAFDQNGAMYGPPYYIEKAVGYNASTQLYKGQVVAHYFFGSSLPVYNITKLPTT